MSRHETDALFAKVVKTARIVMSAPANQAAIKALAKALPKNGTMRGKEVAAIIAASDIASLPPTLLHKLRKAHEELISVYKSIEGHVRPGAPVN